MQRMFHLSALCDLMQATGKRWRVEVSAQVDAALLLSAVNLPGGVQRRRTAEDELNMRAFFLEGDLLTVGLWGGAAWSAAQHRWHHTSIRLVQAEVQAVHHDGSIMLHTRSSKYGRLQGGLVVAATPTLIKRQKQHFVQLGGGTGKA